MSEMAASIAERLSGLSAFHAKISQESSLVTGNVNGVVGGHPLDCVKE